MVRALIASSTFSTGKLGLCTQKKTLMLGRPNKQLFIHGDNWVAHSISESPTQALAEWPTESRVGIMHGHFKHCNFGVVPCLLHVLASVRWGS